MCCAMLCVMRTWWRGCAAWLPGVKINMFAFCLCFPSRPFSRSYNHNHQGSIPSPVVTTTRYFSSDPVAPKYRVWMNGGLNLPLWKSEKDSHTTTPVSAEGISLVLPFYHNAIWRLSGRDIGEREGLQSTPSIEPSKKEPRLVTQPLTMLL